MEKSAILLPWIKNFILIILLVLLICSSPGTASGFKDGMDQLTSPRGEVTIQMKVRKLIGLEAMLDYQDPSANPIHDPKKGSSGGKGGNNP